MMTCRSGQTLSVGGDVHEPLCATPLFGSELDGSTPVAGCEAMGGDWDNVFLPTWCDSAFAASANSIAGESARFAAPWLCGVTTATSSRDSDLKAGAGDKNLSVCPDGLSNLIARDGGSLIPDLFAISANKAIAVTGAHARPTQRRHAGTLATRSTAEPLG